MRLLYLQQQASNHIRLAKCVSSSHEFRFPAFYRGLLPDLVKVSPYRRHVWDDICLETISEPGVVEPKVKEGVFGKGGVVLRARIVGVMMMTWPSQPWRWR